MATNNSYNTRFGLGNKRKAPAGGLSFQGRPQIRATRPGASTGASAFSNPALGIVSHGPVPPDSPGPPKSLFPHGQRLPLSDPFNKKVGLLSGAASSPPTQPELEKTVLPLFSGPDNNGTPRRAAVMSRRTTYPPLVSLPSGKRRQPRHDEPHTPSASPPSGQRREPLRGVQGGRQKPGPLSPPSVKNTHVGASCHNVRCQWPCLQS